MVSAVAEQAEDVEIVQYAVADDCHSWTVAAVVERAVGR